MGTASTSAQSPGSETGVESKYPTVQFAAPNRTLLQQTHSLRLLNTIKVKAISGASFLKALPR